MNISIIPQDEGHPEVHVWVTDECPIIGLSVFCAGSTTVGLSFTRHQIALLAASLQTADNELAAREAVTV